MRKRTITASVAVGLVLMVLAFAAYRTARRVSEQAVLHSIASDYTVALHEYISTNGILPVPPISRDERATLIADSRRDASSARQYIFPILDADRQWLIDLEASNVEFAPYMILVAEGLNEGSAVILTNDGPKLSVASELHDFSLSGRNVLLFGRSVVRVPTDLSPEKQVEFIEQTPKRMAARHGTGV